jgi:tRNA pseudouridine38-40 synthase
VRLRLDLAYDGTGFHGWAAQPGLRTVQAEVEAALATVLRRPAPLTCAGRTDAGVHARGQVVHLDVEPALLEQAAGRSAGPPTDVRVLRAAEAADGFDARFSALWRRYVYRICDVPSAADPRTRTFVVPWPRPLDEEAMNEAARALLGEHDFAAFCKQREGASTVRELLELRVARTREGLDTTVRADAFCHSMVRALMGCLVAVGEGRRPASWAGEVLGSAVRDPAVTVMPAHGLTLDEVCYPGDTELASRASATRRLRVPEGS